MSSSKLLFWKNMELLASSRRLLRIILQELTCLSTKFELCSPWPTLISSTELAVSCWSSSGWDAKLESDDPLGKPEAEPQHLEALDHGVALGVWGSCQADPTSGKIQGYQNWYAVRRLTSSFTVALDPDVRHEIDGDGMEGDLLAGGSTVSHFGLSGCRMNTCSPNYI